MSFYWVRRLFTKGLGVGRGRVQQKFLLAEWRETWVFGDVPGNVAIIQSPERVTGSLYDLEGLIVSGHRAWICRIKELLEIIPGRLSNLKNQ